MQTPKVHGGYKHSEKNLIRYAWKVDIVTLLCQKQTWKSQHSHSLELHECIYQIKLLSAKKRSHFSLNVIVS